MNTLSFFEFFGKIFFSKLNFRQIPKTLLPKSFLQFETQRSLVLAPNLHKNLVASMTYI